MLFIDCVPLNSRVEVVAVNKDTVCMSVMRRDVFGDEMQRACVVYGQWLVDASQVTDDDKVPVN